MKISGRIQCILFVATLVMFTVAGCSATGDGRRHSMRSTQTAEMQVAANTTNNAAMEEEKLKASGSGESVSGNGTDSNMVKTGGAEGNSGSMPVAENAKAGALHAGAVPGAKIKTKTMSGAEALSRSGKPENAQVKVANNSENHSGVIVNTSKKTPAKAWANAVIVCEQHGANQQRYYLKTPSGDKKLVRVRVGASGYGAPPKNYYPAGQRRLMTMRAAKVDAYRALAEVVGGLHVWGGSAISDMVLQRDRYRTFVDTYVRGARVIDVLPMDDETYKTTVEMTIDQSFLSQVMAFVDPGVDKMCSGENNEGMGVRQGDGGPYAYYGSENVSPTFYYSE